MTLINADSSTKRQVQSLPSFFGAALASYDSFQKPSVTSHAISYLCDCFRDPNTGRYHLLTSFPMLRLTSVAILLVVVSARRHRRSPLSRNITSGASFEILLVGELSTPDKGAMKGGKGGMGGKGGKKTCKSTI